MNEQLLVNAWYKEWVKLNDPLEEDFEDEIYKVLPDIKFTYDGKNDLWIRLW